MDKKFVLDARQLCSPCYEIHVQGCQSYKLLTCDPNLNKGGEEFLRLEGRKILALGNS